MELCGAASTSTRNSWRLRRPCVAFNDRAISVVIAECAAALSPIWGQRFHGLKSSRGHCFAGAFPLWAAGNVEDKQVLRCRLRRYLMYCAVNKFEVIAATRKSNHGTVESGVIFELTEDL